MRCIAYAVAASTSVFAVSEVTPVPAWIQGSALAVLAGVLSVLLLRTVPAILKASRDERTAYLAVIQAEQGASMEERKQYRESIDRFGEKLASFGERIAHCPHNDSED